MVKASWLDLGGKKFADNVLPIGRLDLFIQLAVPDKIMRPATLRFFSNRKGQSCQTYVIVRCNSRVFTTINRTAPSLIYSSTLW